MSEQSSEVNFLEFRLSKLLYLIQKEFYKLDLKLKGRKLLPSNRSSTEDTDSFYSCTVYTTRCRRFTILRWVCEDLPVTIHGYDFTKTVEGGVDGLYPAPFTSVSPRY